MWQTGLSSMPENPLAEIAELPTAQLAANGMYRVLYDGQCQACVSWLKGLRQPHIVGDLCH
jgi:hypothetical protein